MENPIERYWKIRLEKCRKALEANHFRVFVADDSAHARNIVLEDILPKADARLVSWGDSMTMQSTGILDALRGRPELEIIVTFDKDLPREETLERRRQALLSDLFFTGSNAVTEKGQLVNLDMIGNRVAGITFGPKHVVIFVGRNKIVPDVEEAVHRIKNYTAPANIIRHDYKTPCAKTASCVDCKSPQRICNVWTITEKSWPEGRIKVILINKDLGL